MDNAYLSREAAKGSS